MIHIFKNLLTCQNRFVIHPNDYFWCRCHSKHVGWTLHKKVVFNFTSKKTFLQWFHARTILRSKYGRYQKKYTCITLTLVGFYLGKLLYTLQALASMTTRLFFLVVVLFSNWRLPCLISAQFWQSPLLQHLPSLRLVALYTLC